MWVQFSPTLFTNKIKKGLNIIIQITKQEAFQLQDIGYKFGNEGIHKSQSRYPKYYLTETSKALKDLKQIRKTKVIKQN